MRVAVVVTLCLWAAQASADKPPESIPTAILPLEHPAQVTLEQATQVRAAMREPVERHGLAPMAFEELDRRLAATDITCTTAKCLSDTARVLQATFLVGGRLTASEERRPPDWKLALWVYDAEGKATRATVEDRCQGCSLVQACVWAGKVTKRLLRQVKHARSGRLDIRSEPKGATVLVDGERVGATDMEFRVPPGIHTVEVRAEGHVPQSRRVQVKPAEKVRMELTLEPVDGPAPPPEERTSLLDPGVFKWVTLGAALAGIGAGAGLLAINGRQVCDGSDPDLPAFECDEQYSTVAPGVSLMVAGAALGGLAGYLFYLDIERQMARPGDAPEDAPEGAADEAAARVSVGPWAGPRGAGLSATIGF